MDYEYYVNVLQNSQLSIVDAFYGSDWTLEQDNASVHTLNVTPQLFELCDIDVLDWPTKLLDSNLIENLWGISARKVYREGRFLQGIFSPQDAIMDAWSDVEIAYICTLYGSMPSRFALVVQNNGEMTMYQCCSCHLFGL